VPENKRPYGSPGAGYNQPPTKILIDNPPAATVAQALANAKKQVDAAK
jgi:hypothetical protein